MAETLAEPRAELSEHAPQVLTIKIEPDQIGLLIGKGGETIRGLQEEFEVKIDIEEDGFVRIYGVGRRRGQAARDRIDEMTRPISVGDVYTAGASSRPPTSAPSSSSARAPTACCTSRASRRACASTPSSRCSIAATS